MRPVESSVFCYPEYNSAEVDIRSWFSDSYYFPVFSGGLKVGLNDSSTQWARSIIGRPQWAFCLRTSNTQLELYES